MKEITQFKLDYLIDRKMALNSKLSVKKNDTNFFGLAKPYLENLSKFFARY